MRIKSARLQVVMCRGAAGGGQRSRWPERDFSSLMWADHDDDDEVDDDDNDDDDNEEYDSKLWAPELAGCYMN